MGAFVAVEETVESSSRATASESIGEEEKVFLGGGGPMSVVISSVLIERKRDCGNERVFLKYISFPSPPAPTTSLTTRRGRRCHVYLVGVEITSLSLKLQKKKCSILKAL